MSKLQTASIENQDNDTQFKQPHWAKAHGLLLLADAVVFVAWMLAISDVLTLTSGLNQQVEFIKLISGSFYTGALMIIPFLHVTYAVLTLTSYKEVGKKLLYFSFFVAPAVGFLMGFPLSSYVRSLPEQHDYVLCSKTYENAMGYHYVWAAPGVPCDGYKSWRKEQLNQPTINP